MDLGTTNTCISRWNEKTEQPEIIHLESICRKTMIGLEKLELPSIIPSSIYITPSSSLISRIGLLPFFRKNFFIGTSCLIGMQAIEKQMNQKDINFIGNFKNELSIDPYYITIDRIEFVEYVLPLTKGFRSDEIKQKALKTIDSLQKDVPENLKGMLSVIDVSSEDGNLTLSEDDDENGKLSLEK